MDQKKEKLTMINERFRNLTGMSWEEAATRSNELFLEADKLDDLAYRLLTTDQMCASNWDEFASAKRAAISKRTQARREWLRATRILHSIDPKAGMSRDPSLH